MSRTALATVLVIGSLLLCSGLCLAQDVMKVAADHYKVRVENDHVRVVENILGPGEKDPMHTHPAGWYYVTKPGTMKIVRADGKVETWEATAGEAGWMEAEGPHTSENVGKEPMGFILVEVKSAAKK
ncbi:MAG: cupin domain-containing protein [Acidobacteriia bacterium]|nr:cupin domain-containing protein [Terriglobia bacterium]